MEDSQKKFEKEEEKFIPKPAPKKKKKMDPDDEKIDTSFDSDSLALYGASLSEQLDTQTPGEEKFTPSLRHSKVNYFKTGKNKVG